MHTWNMHLSDEIIVFLRTSLERWCRSIDEQRIRSSHQRSFSDPTPDGPIIAHAIFAFINLQQTHGIDLGPETTTEPVLMFFALLSDCYHLLVLAIRIMRQSLTLIFPIQNPILVAAVPEFRGGTTGQILIEGRRESVTEEVEDDPVQTEVDLFPEMLFSNGCKSVHKLSPRSCGIKARVSPGAPLVTFDG
jgi:hypothetical protein